MKAQASKKTILVADDDPGILDVITLMLEDEGYVVKTTTNGATVKKMKDNLPDLLLLDLWMSGMDGRDVCAYLKSKDKTRKIPIVIVSANKDAEKIAKDCGADDFLAKPFEMEDLLAIVKKYIKD